MYKVQLISEWHIEQQAISSYVGPVYPVVLDSSPVDIWTIGCAKCLDNAQNLDAKPYPRKDK
jgi:hypothetical protein